MSEDLFSFVEAEDWLAERIKQHGCDLYLNGEFPTMRDRIRAAILANGIQVVITGRHDGKPENYAQTFERLYGEPLEATKSKRAKERP
jgi:hypothetical protein